MIFLQETRKASLCGFLAVCKLPFTAVMAWRKGMAQCTISWGTGAIMRHMPLNVRHLHLDGTFKVYLSGPSLLPVMWRHIKLHGDKTDGHDAGCPPDPGGSTSHKG